MGRIAHLRMQCPHCSKTTSIYVEECDSERVDVKCEHCLKVFEFGPGAAYQPVAYVPAMPSWAVIDRTGQSPQPAPEKRWWAFWR
jgi:phage FluMu protein Com